MAKAVTDRLTGRVVLGPRQYDPMTLRFGAPDTFIASDLDVDLATDELTGNRYLFAAANPVAFTRTATESLGGTWRLWDERCGWRRERVTLIHQGFPLGCP